MDKKLFLLWIHDKGLIGPETLSICDELIEVKQKTNYYE